MTRTDEVSGKDSVGDGAAPLCFHLLERGEFGDLLHGLGVQRIQPLRDLAGHMVGAARRHPDRRCPHVGFVRQRARP
ncbi:hypothetical protein [Streptomyces sp. NPDC052107]|uniref:hypothetical protein n=1 Tax=Streptomyces sp. NPDC052107 TaxID=3155632 RepID=UPI0034212401